MPHTHWDEPTISWKPDLNNTKCDGTAPTISCRSSPFPFYWPASCTCARWSAWQTWRFFLTNRSELLLPLDTQLPLPVQDDKQTSLATYIHISIHLCATCTLWHFMCAHHLLFLRFLKMIWSTEHFHALPLADKLGNFIVCTILRICPRWHIETFRWGFHFANIWCRYKIKVIL